MTGTYEECDICGDPIYMGCVIDESMCVGPNGREPGCCPRCTKAVRHGREQKAYQDSICKECGFHHPGGSCMDS